MEPLSNRFMPNDINGLWLQKGSAFISQRNRKVDTPFGNRSDQVSGTAARSDDVSSQGPIRRMDSYECQTCKNRKYQDGSDDPGVSYKNPTKISPDKAASAVRGHEMEHVTREQAKAKREGREVLSQTVSIHTSICPECGKVYVSGGTTRTVTRGQKDLASLFQAGLPDAEPKVGQYFSATA